MIHHFEESLEDEEDKIKKSSDVEEDNDSESEPKEKKRLTGTILWWQNGAGQILADSGEALAVHQVDLQCSGIGERVLPINHMCEYERCVGQMGEPRACEVSRSGGRSWVFKNVIPETMSTEKDSNSMLPGLKPPIEEAHADQQLKYLCTEVTDRTIVKGIVLYFNAELHYACIKPEDEPEGQIFCDASGIVKSGSYMCVRRGVKVEYIKGTNEAGLVVATECTGPDQKPIDNKTKKAFLPSKRKLQMEMEKRKKEKKVEPDIELPPKPDIPEGKNPVSIINEFAVCCSPKKIVTFKLVEEEIRARPTNGIRTAFTFECRLDDEPVEKGTAQTKRVAKTYAAQLSLENLSEKNAQYKAEIERIRNGLPAVKKRPPPFVRSYGQNKGLVNSYVLSRAQGSSYGHIRPQGGGGNRAIEIPYNYRHDLTRKAPYPDSKISNTTATSQRPTTYERAYDTTSKSQAPSTSYSAAYSAPSTSAPMNHQLVQNGRSTVPPPRQLQNRERPADYNGYNQGYEREERDGGGFEAERQVPTSYARAYHPPAQQRYKESNNISLQAAYLQAQTNATRSSYAFY